MPVPVPETVRLTTTGTCGSEAYRSGDSLRSLRRRAASSSGSAAKQGQVAPYPSSFSCSPYSLVFCTPSTAFSSTRFPFPVSLIFCTSCLPPSLAFLLSLPPLTFCTLARYLSPPLFFLQSFFFLPFFSLVVPLPPSDFCTSCPLPTRFLHSQFPFFSCNRCLYPSLRFLQSLPPFLHPFVLRT